MLPAVLKWPPSATKGDQLLPYSFTPFHPHVRAPRAPNTPGNSPALSFLAPPLLIGLFHCLHYERAAAFPLLLSNRCKPREQTEGNVIWTDRQELMMCPLFWKNNHKIPFILHEWIVFKEQASSRNSWLKALSLWTLSELTFQCEAT